MNEICGIHLDFPVIEGVSDRQVWYAENLRERYIRENEDRFREIEEATTQEVDKRDTDYTENQFYRTWEMEFTEEERACLYGIHAGGIISTLKDRFEGGLNASN